MTGSWTKSAIADTTSTNRTASTSSLPTTITSYNGTIPTSSSATTTVTPIPNRLTTTSHHRVGTIVGSVIGSVVGLAALTALALVIWREKNVTILLYCLHSPRIHALISIGHFYSDEVSRFLLRLLPRLSSYLPIQAMAVTYYLWWVGSFLRLRSES